MLTLMKEIETDSLVEVRREHERWTRCSWDEAQESHGRQLPSDSAAAGAMESTELGNK